MLVCTRILLLIITIIPFPSWGAGYNKEVAERHANDLTAYFLGSTWTRSSTSSHGESCLIPYTDTIKFSNNRFKEGISGTYIHRVGSITGCYLITRYGEDEGETLKSWMQSWELDVQLTFSLIGDGAGLWDVNLTLEIDKPDMGISNFDVRLFGDRQRMRLEKRGWSGLYVYGTTPFQKRPAARSDAGNTTASAPLPKPTSEAKLGSSKRWIVIASRSDQQEAISVAKQYKRSFHDTFVVLSENGNYGVVIGPAGSDRSLVDQLINTNQIPSDSYISLGNRFRSIVWQ